MCVCVCVCVCLCVFTHLGEHARVGEGGAVEVAQHPAGPHAHDAHGGAVLGCCGVLFGEKWGGGMRCKNVRIVVTGGVLFFTTIKKSKCPSLLF